MSALCRRPAYSPLSPYTTLFRSVGQYRRGGGQLQRGDLPVALADAHREGLPRVPGLVEARSLPVPGGHQGGALAEDVIANPLTEAEGAHVLVEIGRASLGKECRSRWWPDH